MQDVEKDGCWFMTIGHVFYQEPVRVVSQIFFSPVQNYFQTAVNVGDRGGCGWGGGEGRGGQGEGLNFDSIDSCVLHISSNDAG